MTIVVCQPLLRLSNPTAPLADNADQGLGKNEAYYDWQVRLDVHEKQLVPSAVIGSKHYGVRWEW